MAPGRRALNALVVSGLSLYSATAAADGASTGRVYSQRRHCLQCGAPPLAPGRSLRPDPGRVYRSAPSAGAQLSSGLVPPVRATAVYTEAASSDARGAGQGAGAPTACARAQAKSTAQLLQSLAVFQACALRPLVDNAGWLLPAARASPLSRPLADWAVRHTFFKHFCAGECVATIQPNIAYLAAHGIRPIMQYAAEDDVQDDGGAAGAGAAAAAERACDRNLAVFMQAIRDSDNVACTAIVAVKARARPALRPRPACG